MQQQIFSVFDSKAEAFLPPFYAPTPGVAMRSFEAAANSAEHDFHKYAGDYMLFQLGSFEDSTGKFEIRDVPVSLGLAITFIRGSENGGNA